MPLTPEDVSNKRFTPVRLREGYDMGEVDQFLDEVEAELGRLTRENEDLRGKLAAAQNGRASGSAAAVVPASATSSASAPSSVSGAAAASGATAAQKDSQPASAQQSGATATVGGPVETIKVATVAEASSAAARLLELATRNADQLVGEAKEQADGIVGEARTKAERLESDSKSKADRVEADARSRAQMLDSETAERRQRLFGDLEKERDRLGHEVENLRSFEREYRSRLRSYFEQQLAALDGNGGDGDNAGTLQAKDKAPSGLQSLLGEEETSQGSQS